jgi:hypothetical protein
VKSSILLITIAKKLVKEWNLMVGQIVEISTPVEGQDIFVKLKKVNV